MSLQHLRGHRHCNHLGLLAFNAGHTDRAGDMGEFFGAETTRFKPVPEGRPFGLAANQADVRSVAALALTRQAQRQHIEVFSVAETHDQHP